MNEVPGYDVRNGGNTSRFGSEKVFIFKHEDRKGIHWQAHCVMKRMEGNAFGAGNSPREAYANLMRGMLDGRSPAGRASDEQIDSLCRLTPQAVRARNPEGRFT